MTQRPSFFDVYFKFIVLLGSLSFVIACDNSETRQVKDFDINSTDVTKDTLESKDVAPVIQDPYPTINYKLDTIKNTQHLKNVMALYGHFSNNKIANKIFITLNRKESRFIRVGSAIVIPDTIVEDIRAYSVFPYYYHGARDIPKLIMVSNVYQSYACYENGYLVRFAATNTGKERTPSFPGRYAVTWKKKEHRSSIDSNWVMPYTINFHPQAGSAFHKFVMPGYPASHSCLRQFLDDAEWLYHWVNLIKFDENKKPIRMSGTPVIIIDYYDFNEGQGGKWKYLTSNKQQIDYLPQDPMSVEEAIIPISQIPVDARGSLVDYNKFRFGEDTLRARGVIRPGVRLIETRNFNRERRQKQQAEQKRLMQLEKQKLDSLN